MNDTNYTPKLNDFFYDTFGYDATLVNFYQIVRVVSDKTLEVREVRNKWVNHDSVIPAPNEFVGETKRIRRTKYGFKYWPWKGKPLYQSPVGTY